MIGPQAGDEVVTAAPPNGGSHDKTLAILAEMRASILSDLRAGPEAIDDAQAPDFLSFPRLPICGANLAAPGGHGKTAVALAEKVHIVAGHKLYDSPVDVSGPCVLVTAEDGVNRARYVLQQMLKDGVDCGALPESAAKAAKQHIKIIGWDRSKFGPIVSVDQFGGMHRAPAFDVLLELLEPIHSVYNTFDPAVMFGAGERYGNDGDAFFAAMLHVTALEMNCCCQALDHVSQAVARNGIVDQYAARGGTAKTDNARLARQLVLVTDDPKETLPLRASREDAREGRLLQLHWTKSNFGPKPAPVWLRRRRFWIEYLPTPTPMQSKQASEAVRTEQAEEDVALTVEYLAAQLKIGRGIRHTRNSLEQSPPSLLDGKPMSRVRVRRAVARALALERLHMADLPEDERQGAKQQYLRPV